MSTKTWIAFGDIHEDMANAARIPGIGEADGVIITGDMTNHGGPARVAGIVEAVRRLNPTVLAQIGNMDMPEAEERLTAMGVNMNRRAVTLAPGLKLLGVGWSSPTPFGTPSEVEDKVLSQWLDEALGAARADGGYEHLVLACHTPPYNTAADRIGNGAHVGSPAVRAFIERVQPDVCLTGHIHEAASADTLGRTQVVNPGMLSKGGYAVLSFDGERAVAELKRL